MYQPKSLFFFILLLSVNIAISQTPQNHEIKTEIEQITIHLNGAEVYRTGKVNLNVGKHQLIFTDLSPKINPQTIRTATPEGVTILSITSRINFLKQKKEGSPEIVRLQDSLEQQQIAFQDIQDLQNGFEQEKKLLERNQVLGSKENTISVEEILRAGELYRQRHTAINRELAILARKQQNVSEQIARLKAQLQELNVGNQYTSEIYLIVKTERSVNADFQLQYVVNEAGWSPIYDLQSGKLSEPINLKYRALAYNNTGIEWNNIKIKLSTADPLQSANKPQLSTWLLKENAPIALNRQQGRLNYYNQNQLNDFNNTPQTYSNESGSIRFETIEVSELSNEFDIEEPYSIPSDRKPYSIEITNYDLEASYKHFCVPKVDKDAFLVAQITGWEKLELIAGPINIYRHNTYIGLANLDTRNLSDTLDLSLGRDKNVLVKRVKQEELSKKQFLGNNKKWTVAYKISVKNNHDTAIDMELLDQIPISNDKEISVDVQEISGATLFEKTGKLQWTFSLNAGESRSFDLGFSVKYPKTKEIEMQKRKEMVTPRFF